MLSVTLSDTRCSFFEKLAKSYNIIQKCYFGGSLMLQDTNLGTVFYIIFLNVTFVAGQCYYTTVSNMKVHSISTNVTLTTQYHLIFFT